jgi:hypothetical protein
VIASALVTAGGTPLDECVEFSLDGDGLLQVELLNFIGPCGTSWKGEAQHVKDGLVLKGKNPTGQCLVARCGGCQYDLRFTVAGVEEDRELALRTEIGGCGDESGKEGSIAPIIETLTLPLHEKRHGILCRKLGETDAAWFEP